MRPCDTLQWMARDEPSQTTLPQNGWVARLGRCSAMSSEGFDRTPTRVWRSSVWWAPWCIPSVVRRRVERLRDLGHCEQVPSMAPVVGGIQGPVVIQFGCGHSRVLSGPGDLLGLQDFRVCGLSTTMMDPVGLFSSRDTIIQHVLQTFHRHALTIWFFCAHEDGVEEMRANSKNWPMERICTSGPGLPGRRWLLPRTPPARCTRSLPNIPILNHDRFLRGWWGIPYLMLAMDQFKDFRGYTDYAARLQVVYAGCREPSH